MGLAEEASLVIENADEIAGLRAGGFCYVRAEDPWMARALPVGRFAGNADLWLIGMFQPSIFAGC